MSRSLAHHRMHRVGVALAMAILVLPVSMAQLPADDPASVLESLAASQVLPRNEGVQRLLPPNDVQGPPPSALTPGADAAPGDAPATPPTSPVGTGSMSSAALLTPVPGPMGTLMAALEDADVQTAGRAIMDYYVAMGIAPDLPELPLAQGTGGASGDGRASTPTMRDDAPPTRPSEMDENQTITYTYSLGDVNHDGVGDLLLDQYCPRTAPGCPNFSNQIDGGGVVRSSSTLCGHPHVAQVISGSDGKPLWNMSMDHVHRLYRYSTFCSLEFTVGTVPLGDGTYGMLSYQYELVEFFGRFDIVHTLRLYEMTAGNVEWTWQETGYYGGFVLGSNAGAIVASNIVLHPGIDAAPAEGPYLAPEGNIDALTIVGVGYRYLMTNTWYAPPSWDHAPIIVQDYQADEWAERLDPATGESRWRQPTFTGDPSRTVLPQSWWGASIAGNAFLPEVSYDDAMIPRNDAHYWNYQPCCHDLDGDGHPELIYTTLEVTNLPSSNIDGPYGFDSRLVVFSGADGSQLYEHVLAQDHDVAYLTTRVVALGDIDADGFSDFLLERMSLEPRPEYRWSFRAGHDGSELWRIDNVRRMELIVPGDVDGDGGNDILLLEWFQHEYYNSVTTPYANVTHTPMKVFSGATGEVVWRRESFIAAADLDRMVDNARTNGLPDLDGDGVFDVPVMDPIYLPDGTIIHRTSFYSPVTDEKLAYAVTAGTFAVPVRAGDVTGDGREDFTLLNGDLLDLWVTTYDGEDGSAIWSRRISDLRSSSSASAIPLLRNHDVSIPGGTRVDLVVNFQMTLVTTGAYYVSTTNKQMVAGLVGHNGTLLWSTPKVYEAAASPAIAGASPASALFAELLRPKTFGETLSVWRPSPLGGTAAFAAAGLASFLIARRLTP